MTKQENGGGCSVHGSMEICGHTDTNCPDKVKTESAEEGEKLTPQDKWVGVGENYCGADVKVTIDSNGEVRFAGDLQLEGSTLGESDLKAFFDAGILDDTKRADGGVEGVSSYNPYDEGFDGWANISQADLNQALDSGILKIEVDEEDDYKLKIVAGDSK